MSSADPLVPSETPFNYNVGINYESWEYGRTGYSIIADLDQITQYFKLIKTFHDTAVGTANPQNPIIDPTQKEVIDYVVAHSGVELVMGTNNNALAAGGFGTPWQPGLMTSRAYTDAWVEMLIEAFGGVANVKVHLKAVLLGNEIDMNGPPPDNASFTNYYKVWIPAAFDNLKASLKAAGLGMVPISTTIANYGVNNKVSTFVPNYIESHWSPSWNDSEPFVFFNQYTPGFQSTDFSHVISYLEGVDSALAGEIEPFVGETGYSSFYGAANQALVYGKIFDWLDTQRASGGKTVPLFAFDAFDRPTATPAREVSFGIFGEDANSQPTGLKPDLVGKIPAWTDDPINMVSKGDDSLYGTSAANILGGGPGDDTILGLAGDDTLRGHRGNDLLDGGAGDDSLGGGDGHDRLEGGDGDDRISGGAGPDGILGGDGADTAAGNAGDDRILGNDGDDRLFGGDGNDTIFGNRGDDLLRGMDGDDRLSGGPGRDTIDGGAGDDVIAGEGGSDRLTGGPGADTFVLTQRGRADLITDIGDDDRIALDSAFAWEGLHVEQAGPFAVIMLGFRPVAVLVDTLAETISVDDFLLI